MVTLVKLGGSLITDKRQNATLRVDVLNNLVRQLQFLHREQYLQNTIIGHGSGSFGHFEAQKYQTHRGVYSQQDWLGYAKVHHVANHLNFLIMQALIDADIPAITFQPSATSVTSEQKIVDLNVYHIQLALGHGLIPVVHGDVSFDEILGGTIVSTEIIFDYLVEKLPISRIILLGEVNGVYDQNGQHINEITPGTFSELKNAFQGASGVDVTGGMLAKVSGMLQLVEKNPELQIHIVNGLIEDNLIAYVTRDIQKTIGTIIKYDVQK